MTPALLLTKLGLTYEDLRMDERETFQQFEEVMREKMTLEKLKEFIQTQRESLLMEFADPENSKEKDLFIKARAKNYSLLLFFMETPNMAKNQLEAFMAKVAANKK